MPRRVVAAYDRVGRRSWVPPASQRMAVIRFSGIADARQVERHSRALEGQLRTRGLRASGPISMAQYDPPWTLWFLRRNEVMVPIAR